MSRENVFETSLLFFGGLIMAAIGIAVGSELAARALRHGRHAEPPPPPGSIPPERHHHVQAAAAH